MQPLVSICIPGYNCSKWIELTIRSALNQNYPNIEILYIDNQSVDNSFNIARNFENSIQLFKNETNIGMMANHNKALGLSKGKYICFPGADDILHPNHVDDLLALLENNPTVVMAIGERQIVDENNTFVDCEPFYNHCAIIPGIEQARVFMMSSMAYTCQVMLRRDTVLKVGGFPLDTLVLEAMLWYKSALEGDVAYTKRVVAAYRNHSENMTAGLSKGLEYAYEHYTSYHQIINLARHHPYLSQFCDAAYKNIGNHMMRIAQRSIEIGCVDTAKAYMNMALAYNAEIENSYTYKVFRFCLDSTSEYDPLGLYNRLKDTLPISLVRRVSYNLPQGSIIID